MTVEDTFVGNGSAANGTADGRHFRVAIIGSGFSGLGLGIRLKQAGVDDFVVLEKDGDVGGTWWANTYPGCQCDIPSHLYSFSFAPNPGWSRTYSYQPEIWAYLRRCAERFGIVEHVRTGHEVLEAEWVDDEERWRITTSRGIFTARFLVSGIGGLSEPSIPDIPGLDTFEGEVFHSARWNHDHDLKGERVASIGTGASAIQYVPRIQPEVAKLHVFQRTPPWVMPHGDRPVTGLERRLYRRFPPAQRAVRTMVYWMREALVPALMGRRLPQRVLQLVGRRHLRRQVPDRELRRRLKPRYDVGCKRILPSNAWYPALQQPNVELVTDGIEAVTPKGIRTVDGTEREVDTIILGTGFHVTDYTAIDRVRGRDGRTLGDVWQGSPQAYLGVCVAGFPNLFMMVGPNTGLGHNSIVIMIEAQINYILDCLSKLELERADVLEVRPEVQAAFNREIQSQMPGTVWTSGGCASWYTDATGRNTTIWPGFTWRYILRTRHGDLADFETRPAAAAGAPLPARAAAGQ